MRLLRKDLTTFTRLTRATCDFVKVGWGTPRKRDRGMEALAKLQRMMHSAACRRKKEAEPTVLQGIMRNRDNWQSCAAAAYCKG